MVSIALELFTSKVFFSMSYNGSGNRRLIKEAEGMIPCAFSYHETGVHLYTFLKSFCSNSNALLPEKKNKSCPFLSSIFPSGMIRDTCPKPSSEQLSSSLIEYS